MSKIPLFRVRSPMEMSKKFVRAIKCTPYCAYDTHVLYSIVNYEKNNLEYFFFFFFDFFLFFFFSTSYVANRWISVSNAKYLFFNDFFFFLLFFFFFFQKKVFYFFIVTMILSFSCRLWKCIILYFLSFFFFSHRVVKRHVRSVRTW